MLDPAQPFPIDLTDFASYMASCLELAEKRLGHISNLKQLAEQEAQLNAYPRLPELEPPRDILILQESAPTGSEFAEAVETILRGGVFWEHTCAGEATRLNMGPKYLLHSGDFNKELLGQLFPGGLPAHCPEPKDIRTHCLGRRHILQQAWDIWQLALGAGQDPAAALSRQHLLIVVNQHSAEPVIKDIASANFYGFDPQKVLFMVQAVFHGLDVKNGQWFVDRQSPKRLHNHGQMFMQTAMNGQIFRLINGKPHVLPWTDYEELLGGFADKVSFNIEDLDYLACSLDLAGISNALELGRQGYVMIMEVVANDPERPIKGGACYYDPVLRRNVIIESFQLKGIEPKDIVTLNKNVNHYPSPRLALNKVRQIGLSMPVSLKREHVYFQPVQGDVNFLVPTAFTSRSQMKPIISWKAGGNTPAAFKAMYEQDSRPGFWSWASDLTGLDL